jgi:hypothetical protein
MAPVNNTQGIPNKNTILLGIPYIDDKKIINDLSFKSIFQYKLKTRIPCSF